MSFKWPTGKLFGNTNPGEQFDGAERGCDNFADDETKEKVPQHRTSSDALHAAYE